jgi:hypothetical protein
MVPRRIPSPILTRTYWFGTLFKVEAFKKAKLPSCFSDLLTAAGTQSVIQVRCKVRGVKQLMEPIAAAVWTLAPA